MNDEVVYAASHVYRVARRCRGPFASQAELGDLGGWLGLHQRQLHPRPYS